MPQKIPRPGEALETVWLARCPADLQEFGGVYVFASPDPPRLERSCKTFFVWNYGFTVLPANLYHRLFKGLRLHPSEGPRKVALRIERADDGPWVARYPINTTADPGDYVFGHLRNPQYSKRSRGARRWTPRDWVISSQAFERIFSGIRLSPGTHPRHVAMTATAVD